MMCFCKIHLYVDKYVCRGCKRSVPGNVNELKPLISHGLKCPEFDPVHKRMLSLHISQIPPIPSMPLSTIPSMPLSSIPSIPIIPIP